MRGTRQCEVVMRQSGIFQPGVSKHEAKEIARANGAKNSHAIAQETGIYSFRTRENCLCTWRECAKYTKENFGVKDVTKITPAHVADFLRTKLIAGCAYGTIRTYSSQLEKFGAALEKYAGKYITGNKGKYTFSPELEKIKTEAKEISHRGERSTENRAYCAPGVVVRNLREEKNIIAGAIMSEGGARIQEAGLIKKRQLRGIKKDPITGQNVGVIHLEKSTTKGGRERYIYVSPKIYQKLEKYICQNGEFKIKPNAFRRDLNGVCDKLGEKYTGAHGLRYNFAQRRYRQCREAGMNDIEARLLVSNEMGHSRIDITNRYLGI